MRTAIYLFTFLLTAITAAQEETTSFINRGGYELNGSLSFSTSKINRENGFQSESRGTLIIFRPQLGYAVKNDFVLGLGLGFSYSESRNETANVDDINSSTSYAITPFVKKYFNISKNFAFNLQGEIGYSLSSINSTNNQLEDNSSNEISLGIRPGISYRINEKLALQSQIGFLGYSQGNLDNDDTTVSSFNVSLNAQDFTIGISYFF
ncbi:opacity protein-like surface antigen [Nonlabens dokdonensis]|jgi:opacity protein-like surface antigen|uniref:Outer membrane protein beta-barrel domain-containing protein n=2 Tax=Nonlabens dokdonensis TaxID=328515 RepID=L7W5G1_NONDD|nr:outer membrane beta-barrel protein [Nonlabens dokdonensis]AGC76885.1 hypothetical protein DDD_1758 [Nonlabens dokdonensis DSW-6]PZX36794.1 opacity protein-like surface antigen [Nonlabens dokdonensis]